MPTSTFDPRADVAAKTAAESAAGLKKRLIDRAQAEGFSKLRVCSPHSIPAAKDRLKAFLDAGHHGEMAWMAERTAWRGDPGALWPEARSVIMLAETYQGPTDLDADLANKTNGTISAYAKGKDYHDLLKRRLKRLGRWLLDQAGGEIKVFVDTAPVMEKPLAEAAGLGWQGKHTNLLSRDLGNWFFLGAIFTTLDLPPDPAEVSHCGSCTACLDVCPTKAFPAPYQLDARRCISYLTIELKGPVAPDLRPLLGNRIYGCDDCLAACPWNKFAAKAREIGYAHRDIPTDLAYLARLDDQSFRNLFSKSPIKRIGRDRFVRNVLYAIGNSGDPKLIGVAAALMRDQDETVSDAASWAVARLESKDEQINRDL